MVGVIVTYLLALACFGLGIYEGQVRDYFMAVVNAIGFGWLYYAARGLEDKILKEQLFREHLSRQYRP